VQYAYNAKGTLATVTDPAGGITKYTYDASNNLLTVTDARGIVQAQNTLDANGRVVQQVRPDGGALTFSYALLNPLAVTSQVMQAQVTDSQGVQAIYRFNPQGFVTDVTATQGQTRHVERAPGTNVVSFVKEASAATTYTYDSNGNVLTSTDATGLTTRFTYDPVFNKVTSITDPVGNVTRFTYDGHGNLLTSTDANGNTTSYQYDPTGLLLQVTDTLGQKTQFTYDALGNLISVADPLGNTSSYAYDGISRLIETKDALSRLTSFSYDALSRLTKRTDPKSGITQFTYDPDGNLLSVQDARNNTTAFTYDVMNRLGTRTDPLGKADTRAYDTNGNLVSFVDRRGQTSTFTYDNLNRLVGQSYQDATVARTYDVLGRLAQVNDSAAGVFSFAYDLVGRLTSSSNPNGTVNYAYDGRGAMASRQVAGQPALTYTYDPAGNLVSAALPQASANFAYDPRNQLSAISRLNGVSSTFAYDSDARVLSLTHSAGASTIDAESYTYDAVNSRTGHSTSIGQSLITQPTVNQFNFANQLIQFGTVQNSYDANGNLIQEGNTASYAWDARNRLKSIMTAAGQTTTFTYDFAGNLIAQADSGTSLNLAKSFVLDNLTNVAYQTASDGTSYSVLSGRSIDSHLAIAQSNGQVQYGLSDAINSTTATVDQTGAVKAQFLYDSFGQTTATGAYPFQYTGRVPVSANLYYYRARFYNAATGRFISEDAIRFIRKDANLYRYARNVPTNFRDPYGRQASPGDGFTVDVSDQTPHGPYGDWPSWPTSLTPSCPNRQMCLDLAYCTAQSGKPCMPGGGENPDAPEQHGTPSTGVPPLQQCPASQQPAD
jgi:RHS repeat-associated protein